MKTEIPVWVIMDYLTIHKIVDSPKEAYISAIELAIQKLDEGFLNDNNKLQIKINNVISDDQSCFQDYVDALRKYNNVMIHNCESKRIIQVNKHNLECEPIVCKPITVPCKFCKTQLNKGETPCWKCGTANK